MPMTSLQAPTQPRYLLNGTEIWNSHSPDPQFAPLAMKRPVTADDIPNTGDDKGMKKIKTEEDEEEEPKLSPFLSMDENLLYEVLKHVDARTLATAACVSKQWHRTAEDERLWELICASHWPNLGCGNQRRRVVLALGGFRRLYSLHLRRLFKPSPSSSTSSSSVWPCLPPPSLTPVVPSIPLAAAKTRWGKDGVHLSMSLLSIRYFEKLNSKDRSN